MYVYRYNNENIDSLIKRFNQKVQNSNLMQELKDRQAYEKPSIKKRRRKLLARTRKNYEDNN